MKQVMVSRLNVISVVLFAVTAAGLPLCLAAKVCASGPVVLKNPYENVNWKDVNQYKANLHSHTILSDGRAEPDELIYMYADAGYDILAITDHDNYHTSREGEREVEATSETTWPWTDWIVEEPSQVWKIKGVETAALYPDLGERGMLAVRGNELTTHPHIQSLFNNTGFVDHLSDEKRLACIEERGGVSYWSHAGEYVPGGLWEDDVFEVSMDKAVEHFGRYIGQYDSHLGIELQFYGQHESELKLFDRLLEAYYKEFDIFIKGSDDNHNTHVSDNATMTIVFAEELTQKAVKSALEHGHNMVGQRGDEQPVINGIWVDGDANLVNLDVDNYDRITWIKNGKPHGHGSSIDYSEMREAVLRFEIETADSTFYSQAFYVQ